MAARPENCPYAFRVAGDPNVHCRKIQEIPNVRWTYCSHQFNCRQTGRWEATKNAGECKYRKNGKEGA